MLPLDLPFAPMSDQSQKGSPKKISKTSMLTRGVSRLFADMGFGTLTEFRLPNGRRVDIIALSSDGIFSIIEVKSSVQDFRGDSKWPNYLPYCNRFYFAVEECFPLDALPGDCGIIIADKFTANIEREPAERSIKGARRQLQIKRFALIASERLQRIIDPRP